MDGISKADIGQPTTYNTAIVKTIPIEKEISNGFLLNFNNIALPKRSK